MPDLQVVVEQLTSGGAAAPSMLIRVGKTAPVSLLSTGVHAIDAPLIAGKLAMLIVTEFVVQPGRIGTATGQLRYKIGNNVARDNMIVTQAVVAAPFNATTYPLPYSLAGPTAGGLPDMSSGLELEIVEALAGASGLTGRLGLLLMYV